MDSIIELPVVDNRPSVGLIGHGRFGGMIRQYLRDRVELRVYDTDPARLSGVSEAAELAEVCRCRYVVLAVPISAMPATLDRIRPLVGPEAVVLDTCSVKVRPVEWMLARLPGTVEVLGTHPLFGPDSGRDGIEGLKVVLCPARVSEESLASVRRFLEGLGLVVLVTSPEEHDRQMALTQAIFHWLAQAFGRLGWGLSPIATPGPEAFLRLIRTVQNDTRQLFFDMERQNPFAAEYRRRFLDELEKLDAELRQELGETEAVPESPPGEAAS